MHLLVAETYSLVMCGNIADGVDDVPLLLSHFRINDHLLVVFLFGIFVLKLCFASNFLIGLVA